MAGDQGFRGQFDPGVLESERLALAMVRALLDSGRDDPHVPDWGSLDEVLDQLGVIDYDALEGVIMSLAQLAFELGAELHGVDRFGDVLTAREVERAGREERSAAGAGFGPSAAAVDEPSGG